MLITITTNITYVDAIYDNSIQILINLEYIILLCIFIIFIITIRNKNITIIINYCNINIYNKQKNKKQKDKRHNNKIDNLELQQTELIEALQLEYFQQQINNKNLNVIDYVKIDLSKEAAFWF